MHHSQAVPVPRELPLDRACLLACGVVTGYGAVVNTAGVAAGDSAVVIGAGGVGLNCIQAAALAGAEPIVAIDLAADRLATATAFGATCVVDPAGDDARQVVRGLTEGRGADCVLVAAGSTAAVELALQLVRRGGTVVIAGMPASGATAAFDPGGIAHDGIRILGSKLGSTRPQVDIPALAAALPRGPPAARRAHLVALPALGDQRRARIRRARRGVARGDRVLSRLAALALAALALAGAVRGALARSGRRRRAAAGMGRRTRADGRRTTATSPTRGPRRGRRSTRARSPA